MSAFLVGKQTIDRILTALDYEIRQSHTLAVKMEEMTGVSQDENNWKDKLGALMLNLNHKALVNRYGDEMVEYSYNYYPELASFTQYLKSLQCFTYQCAEGDIPTTDIYKFFDQVLERVFMTRIIYSMKEYDQAQWA